MLKRLPVWLIALFLFLAVLIPLTLQAQLWQKPPVPSFPPPDVFAPGEEKIPHPFGTSPTPTPNAQDAEMLEIELLSEQPTAEIIDLAPDNEGAKYYY